MSTHNETHDHAHGDEHESWHVHAHVSSVKFMVGIFATLIFLTFITVAVSRVDLGAANGFVAVLVATIKASLVAAFFGLSMKARITGAEATPLSSQIEDLDAAATPANPRIDDTALAVNLPPLGDLTRRFVVRRFLIGDAPEKVVEIECCILPAAKAADDAATRDNLVTAIATEWNKARAK